MRIMELVKRKIFFLVVGVVVLLALVPSYYFYSKYKAAQYRLQNPTAAAAADAKELLGKISKFIQLPTDEEPTIATVSDREKLKDQPFFDNAQNGDQVLLFMKAKKAILYRPSSNKIVEVAPLNINAASPSVSLEQASSAGVTTREPPHQVRFVLWNGTTTIGLTKKYQGELVTKVADATVTDTDTAKKREYEKTLLVDVTGTKTNEAQQVAQSLGITVGTLPEGETAPKNADFLIILGSDYIKK